jgi:hypothetical protein
VSVKDAYVRLNEYARLLSELNEHYDENLDRVVVFRYSDELIRAMNEHEVYSPDDAWLVFADRIDELLNELAAVGTRAGPYTRLRGCVAPPAPASITRRFPIPDRPPVSGL